MLIGKLESRGTCVNDSDGVCVQIPDTAAHLSKGDRGFQSTIGDSIRRIASLQPDHSAIVATGYAPVSYRELQNLIGEMRGVMRMAGFDRTAKVAIGIPHGPQAALATVAVACSAVGVPLNPRQTVRELETYLSRLRPNAVVLIGGVDSAARQAAQMTGTAIIEMLHVKDDFLAFSFKGPGGPTIAQGISDEPDPDAPAFILQTSGTASEPKLIPFSHSNMLAAASRVQGWFNLTPADRCLSVSPLFYSHGLKVTVFTPLLTGGTVAFPSDISKFDYAEWFSFLEPTWYSTGPTLHRLIYDQSHFRGDAKTGHSLRFVMSGGAPLPKNLLKGLQEAFGVPVVEHYGSSEAAQISANLPMPGRSKPGTCGIPPEGVISIVGDDGRPLPPGERGEVLVAGPTVISGYYGAPELNSVSFVDGKFRTGDTGSIDEDGFLILHGRKNDLINRGGEKISPVEIDEALERHPAVLEAAAFAVPHPRLGQDVVAAVVLRSGMTATPIELRSYLQQQLAQFKIPRRIVIKDQLAKGKTGKIQRRLLTESWEQSANENHHVEDGKRSETNLADAYIVEELAAIWERLLGVVPVSLDADFFEIGGDSLLAMEMLTELEWRTGLRVPDSLLFEATTIRQLAEELSSRKIPGPKRLIRMNTSGKQPPLIYFHGNFHGTGHSAITLAKLLGANQPLFIVVPHGTDGRPLPATIEAMAADRLSLILEAQPEGPYRLGGKCLGGLVAYEVARMLKAAGKEVEIVILLDPPTINAYKFLQFIFRTIKLAKPIFGPWADRTMRWVWFRGVQLQKSWMKVHKFIGYSRDKRIAAIRRRWEMLISRSKNTARVESERGSTAPAVVDRWSGEPIFGLSLKDARTSRYAAAMSLYVPQPLDIRTVYIQVDYGVGAWGRISNDLEVIKSSGTHEFPDFAEIAEHMRVRLQPNG